MIRKNNYPNSQEDLTLNLPQSFSTSKGSVYTYQPNGKCDRYKAVTGETFPGLDIAVFIDAPDNVYDELFLIASGQEHKIKIFQGDGAGNPVYSVNRFEDVTEPNDLIVRYERPTGDIQYTASASLYPEVGRTVYDQRVDDQGNILTAHVGNVVTEINY